MPDKKKISELQSVLLGNSDYFAVAHDNSGVRQSGKVSTTEVGQKVNGGIEYSGIHKDIIDHQNPIAAINDLQSYIVNSILPTDSVSASLATITDGADNVVLKSWKTTIIPVQASGTPSPSTPLPITSRTQIVATRTGKNLLGGSKLLANAQAHLPNGVTDTENKTFTYTNSDTVADGTVFSQGMTFKESTRYTFIFTLSGTSPKSNMRIYYKDGTYSAITNPTTANTKETVVYTSNAQKTIDYLTKFPGGGSTTMYYDESGIFEGVVTASDFESYVGESKTISLGQTVYGGEINITSGEVNSDVVLVDYNGSEDWGTNGTSGVWLSVSGLGYIEVAYCNIFEPLSNGSSGSMSNNQIRLNTPGNNLLIKCPDAMTGDEFKTFLQSNPLQVAYKVAPTEISTQGEEFRTFKGDNGFYTDCGDSTVNYRADIALYIAKNAGSGNRSLGLMMNPSLTPTEETRTEIEVQEEIDNDNR